jgi:uncharacterized protein (DUF305 family)
VPFVRSTEESIMLNSDRHHRGTLTAAIAVVTVLALSACASEMPGNGMGGTGMGGDVPDDVNAADVMFVEMMIPHHEQAIEMADIVLPKDDIDPAVTDLATDIKAAQGPEIDLMESWLADWGLPSMAGTGGMSDGGHGGHGGDGMMSADDMEALADADGAEASRLFLEQMIEHHEGAIEMAQYLLDDGENGEVRRLGEAIITAQEAEIELMRELLG